MTTAIEFQHVQKDFNGQTVIPDLNLMVDQGELFVLVGTSGSGKTTSLKMINRLEPLTAGKILVNGTSTGFAVADGVRLATNRSISNHDGSTKYRGDFRDEGDGEEDYQSND